MSKDTGTVFRLSKEFASCPSTAVAPHSTAIEVRALRGHAALLAPTSEARVGHGEGHPRVAWLLAVGLAPVLVVLASWPKAGVVGVTACWTLASVGMSFSNKEAASTFSATCLLVIMQMLIADVVIVATRYGDIRCTRWSDLMKWLAVPFLFAGMLCTSLWALKETTLSTVLILRNVLPLVAFAAEKLLFGTPQRVTAPVVTSMLLALVGTLLYGCCNIAVTHRSAVLVGVSCVLTVLDKLLQRHLLSKPDFGVSLPACMVVNNTVGILPILVMALVTGEVGTWPATVAGTSASTWLLVVTSGLSGYCLGYLGLRLQSLVAATTVLVLQNFSKVMAIALGIALLAEPVSGKSAVGGMLAVIGAAWYGFLQLRAPTLPLHKGAGQPGQPAPAA